MDRWCLHLWMLGIKQTSYAWCINFLLYSRTHTHTHTHTHGLVLFAFTACCFQRDKHTGRLFSISLFMAEHTAEKVIKLFQIQWDDRSNSISVPYLQFCYTMEIPLHGGLQLIIDLNCVRISPIVSPRLSCKRLGSIFCRVQTLARCCVPLDKENICCLQSVSSCLHCTWFRCSEPNCIWGMKSSPSLTPESDIAEETGAHEQRLQGLIQ